MTENKGILIKNIYYMLTYAFQSLKQNSFEEIQAEEFENIHDMFAAILGKGVSNQLKHGLYRDYSSKMEETAVIHGKINISETMKSRMQHKRKITCEYDELTENNLMNQILKTTMLLLLRQGDVKKKHKALLKKNLLLFDSIDTIETKSISFIRLSFGRGNQSYRMLMNICSLVLEGLLLSTKQGNVKLASFLDEQRMCRLYEKFILEYYRYHHPELSPNPNLISWDSDDGKMDFLPVMRTDITLSNGRKVLVIDAKYYEKNMQRYYDVNTIHSANLYQIYTYVKNLDKGHTGDVAGMLLYAKTQKQVQPDYIYSMGGNRVMVKALDLNLPFHEIERQLERILECLYEYD